MYIVGENLRRLAMQKAICDLALVDRFSLAVTLGPKFYRLKGDAASIVRYGAQSDVAALYEQHTSQNGEILINPGEQVLACSGTNFLMPAGYIGFLQTKGTLARLFVSLTCSDAQVEPGFDGYITMEIVNHSPWSVSLTVGSRVGQLYLAKCSNSETAYDGRYKGAAKEGPTLPKLMRD